MKKIYFKLFFASVFIFQFSTLKAQYVTIPDPNLRAYLQQVIPACFNGNLLDTNCAGLNYNDTINVSYLNITDLTGLQYFGYIFYFNCSHNQISQLILPSLPSKSIVLIIF